MSSRNITSVSYCLDPDQARQKVGPDLGPNSLQRLLEDNKFGRLGQTKELALCLHVWSAFNICKQI